MPPCSGNSRCRSCLLSGERLHSCVEYSDCPPYHAFLLHSFILAELPGVDNGVSGKKENRPQLDLLMDPAKKRQIDLILVWKLDRSGRSLKRLVMTLDELSSLGVGFISHQENLDLSTVQGRLTIHIIASMAEFVRELMGKSEGRT